MADKKSDKSDKSADKVEKSEEFLYDKRLLDRNITRGFVTRQEVEKHMSSLADLADKADNIASIVWGNHQG